MGSGSSVQNGVSVDTGCLQHCMTDEQREQFDQQGYLVVPDALDEATLGRLVEAADRVDRDARKEDAIDPGAILGMFRTVLEDDVFLDLLDWPTTFPLIWDILGWNVQHYISHLIYYPPEPKGSVDLKPGGWHQDGGRPIPEMERPQPRLSLKVAFWLSDVSELEHGGIRVVPGSHKWDRPPERDPDDDFEGAIQVLVKAGTAVLFDRRMWHSKGINTSDLTRKVLFLGYSYRWLRGLDYNVIPNEVLERCSPIRRQLLGDGVYAQGWWQPRDEDVPLKGWLLEHKGEAYLERIGEKQWEREKWMPG